MLERIEQTAPLRGVHLGVIGSGVMAEAIIVGLLDKRLVEAASVVCSHPRLERREALRERYGVHTIADNVAAAEGADIVLLAVKPQMLAEAMADLRGSLKPEQLVISVIAGASTQALGEGLTHPAVVRSMPNTPAQIGQGVTVWFATEGVDVVGRTRTRALLSALGREFEVHDERHVAMATAVSGTGPTYIFLFIEALTDAAVHLGFPRHVARELVLDTMQGSAAFALSSGKHVAELRDMVTSPGGTSAEALYELERGRLRTVVSDAVWAAYERTLRLEATLEHRDDARGGGRAAASTAAMSSDVTLEAPRFENGITRYTVRVDSNSYDVGVPEGLVSELAPGLTADELVRESFRFLLQRESPSSILQRFDPTVIERYFPEYRREIRHRLAR